MEKDIKDAPIAQRLHYIVYNSTGHTLGVHNPRTYMKKEMQDTTHGLHI